MTRPYALSLSGDESCQQAFDGTWGFDFTVTASLQDASYDGRTPFDVFASHVEFDLPPDSKDFPKTDGGYASKEGCEAVRQSQEQEAYADAYEWLDAELQELDVDVPTAEVNYVPTADGGHLIELSGSGSAEIHYEPTYTALTKNTIKESWAFDVVFTAEQALNVDAVVHGHGESLDLI